MAEITVVAIAATSSEKLAASCRFEVCGICEIPLNDAASVPAPVEIFQAGLRIFLAKEFEVYRANQMVSEVVHHHHVI